MQIVHKINALLYTIFQDVENENKKDYIISSINNKRFSGNQVLAFNYVSWALAMPEQVQHLGLEFGKEFEMAKKIK
jgi:hypothetical protein